MLLGAGGLCSLCLAPLLFWMGAFPVMEEREKGHLHLKCFWIFSVAEKYSFFDDIEENVFIYVQSQGNIFQAFSLTKTLPFGVKTAVHAGLIALLKRRAYNSTTH